MSLPTAIQPPCLGVKKFTTIQVASIRNYQRFLGKRIYTLTSKMRSLLAFFVASKGHNYCILRQNQISFFWLTMRLLLLIILFFNLSSLLQAQTYDTTYSELRRPGQAVRNLGMGNTGVALSADESALYYNPAGLGGVDSLMLNLNILLEIPAISELQSSQDKLSDGASASIDLLHIRSLNSFSFILPFGDWFTIGAIYSLEYTYDFAVNVDSSGATDAVQKVNIINNSSIGLGMREDGMLRYGLAVAPGTGQWVLGIQQNTMTRREQPFTSVIFKEVTDEVITTSEATTLQAYLDNASAGGPLDATQVQFIDNMTKKMQALSVTELADKIESKFACYTSKKTANS
ncbi:MAG: hypothetical protein ACO3LW_08135, partial [bacterium]